MTNRSENREAAPREGLGLRLAGLGTLTLTGALLFAARADEAVSPSTGLNQNDPPAREAPVEPVVPIVTSPAPVDEGPANRIEVPPAVPPPASDPCGDRELARATFSRALALLKCNDPEITRLSRDFVGQVLPHPTRDLPAEQQRAFLEASQTLFDVAFTDLQRDLGDLSIRVPNAFVHVDGIPADYRATRFEVHPDQFGERRAMVVRYTGGVGVGYTIPATEAGRRFALHKILLDEGSADGAWYTLLTPRDH